MITQRNVPFARLAGNDGQRCVSRTSGITAKSVDQGRVGCPIDIIINISQGRMLSAWLTEGHHSKLGRWTERDRGTNLPT